MNTSNLFNLNVRDAIQGAVVAVLGAVLVVLQQSLTAHTAIDWNQVLVVAEGAFVGYIIKNYFSDAQGKLLGKL